MSADDLAAAQQKLQDLEARVKEQRAYRNDLLRRELAAGMTWKKAREITGMSQRGIQISVNGS